MLNTKQRHSKTVDWEISIPSCLLATLMLFGDQPKYDTAVLERRHKFNAACQLWLEGM